MKEKMAAIVIINRKINELLFQLKGIKSERVKNSAIKTLGILKLSFEENILLKFQYKID